VTFTSGLFHLAGMIVGGGVIPAVNLARDVKESDLQFLSRELLSSLGLAVCIALLVSCIVFMALTPDPSVVSLDTRGAREYCRTSGTVLTSMPARVYVIFWVLCSGATGTTSTLLAFFAASVVESDVVLTWGLMVMAVGCIVSAPMWRLVMIAGVEKPRVEQCCLVVMCLGLTLIFVFGHTVSEMGFLGLLLVWSFGVGGQSFAPAAMKADVTDYDELLNGVRREGLFVSTVDCASKAFAGFLVVALGVVLEAAGYESGQDVQTESVRVWLRVLFCLIPVSLYASAAAILCYYPLSRSVLTDVQEAIRLRRQGKCARDPVSDRELPPFPAGLRKPVGACEEVQRPAVGSAGGVFVEDHMRVAEAPPRLASEDNVTGTSNPAIRSPVTAQEQGAAGGWTAAVVTESVAQMSDDAQEV